MNVLPMGHVLEEFKSGGGNLFLGTLNTIVSDYTNRTTFRQVAAIDPENGLAFDFGDEHQLIKVGSPEEPVKALLVSRSFTMDVTFMESLAYEQGLQALGYGTQSEVAADAVKAITSANFTLYGNNWVKLPYQNITVTDIKDDEATQNTYSGADITTNFEVDWTNGRIRMKTAAEGGTLAAVIYGAHFYLTATWAKPKEKVLTLDETVQEEKNFYSVLVLKPKGDSARMQGIFIPKMAPITPKTMTMKNGEKMIFGCTFQAIRDLTKTYTAKFLDEVSE